MPEDTKPLHIHCAVHGCTEWSGNFRSIIDTPEFQRMRSIRQLGIANLVYPCATHTRFEHSLGVGYVAGRIADALAKAHPERRVPADVLRLAGLCHDIGHGPLSHGFDRYMAGAPDGSVPASHETRSEAILKRMYETRPAVREAFSWEDIQGACDLIVGRRRAYEPYVYDILSNDALDADKLDYLVRDSMHTVKMQSIDIDRIVRMCRVVDERLSFCAPSLILDVNNVVVMRHHMHTLVYQHPCVRNLETMHVDMLRALRPDVSALDAFLRLTDSVTTPLYLEHQSRVASLTEAEVALARHLHDRIAERRLYRRVPEDHVPTEEETRSGGVVKDTSVVGSRTSPLLQARFHNKAGKRISDVDFPSVVPIAMRDEVVRTYARDWSSPA